MKSPALPKGSAVALMAELADAHGSSRKAWRFESSSGRSFSLMVVP
jgi:hypothetical protein